MTRKPRAKPARRKRELPAREATMEGELEREGERAEERARDVERDEPIRRTGGQEAPGHPPE